jgi:hypothetical protein
MSVFKFMSCGERIVRRAWEHAWLPGARYTNLRTVRWCSRLGFLDIDWQRYDFHRHLEAASLKRPVLTVARDVVHYRELDRVLREAEQLAGFADIVIIVPKDVRLAPNIRAKIGPHYLLGFSVPSRYGETTLAPECFDGPVHLLGGRPDVQRRLAERMNVISIDCNRFTLDAKYGKIFNGHKFVRLGQVGYDACISMSMKAINDIWANYDQSSWTACRVTNQVRDRLRVAVGEMTITANSAHHF